MKMKILCFMVFLFLSGCSLFKYEPVETQNSPVPNSTPSGTAQTTPAPALPTPTLRPTATLMPSLPVKSTVKPPQAKLPTQAAGTSPGKKEVQSLGENQYQVVNPSSGAKLYTQVSLPTQKAQGGAYPVMIVVPGGIADSKSIFAPGGLGPRLNEAGFMVVSFDADGRGQSEGQENFNGFVGQDGLAQLIRFAATLPQADAKRLGMISQSYGITLASGALARYPELPVRFLIDWEGPADRQDTTSDCKAFNRISWKPCSDENFWKEREALSFIGKINRPYLRVQSEEDHVQPDVSHAVNMVNAAIRGKNPWVRLNDLTVNQTYDPQNPPQMIPETMKNLDSLWVKYAQEMLRLFADG